MRDCDTGSRFTDILEINTLELPKLSGKTEGEPLLNWLRFLRADDKEELTMITQQNPYIAKAMSILAELSADEEIRQEAEAREKMRRDMAARQLWLTNKSREEGLAEGEARGRAEGEARGRAEGLAEVARSMLKRQMPIDVVVELTGLAKEEVILLQQQ